MTSLGKLIQECALRLVRKHISTFSELEITYPHKIFQSPRFKTKREQLYLILKDYKTALFKNMKTLMVFFKCMLLFFTLLNRTLSIYHLWYCALHDLKHLQISSYVIPLWGRASSNTTLQRRKMRCDYLLVKGLKLNFFS